LFEKRPHKGDEIMEEDGEESYQKGEDKHDDEDNERKVVN
jgi:hypothetical protein